MSNVDGDIKLVENILNNPKSYEEFRTSKICSFCKAESEFTWKMKSDRGNPELGGLFKICRKCQNEEKLE